MAKIAETTPSVWLTERQVMQTYNISRFLAREWGAQTSAIAKIGSRSIRYDRRILDRDLSNQKKQ